MAYNGATAGATLANPPLRIAGGMGGVNQISTGTGGGRGVWLYNSSNGTTNLADANFFSDAYYLGMQRGDIVIGACATGSSVSVFMGVIGAVTTAGAAFASTGGSMTSTFN